ncbi:hypothetical protein TNCV_2172151 [Trichonephila clavipes]|nr:hypothetical protein TNCV_2172151 [Trichonephila clavipes]
MKKKFISIMSMQDSVIVIMDTLKDMPRVRLEELRFKKCIESGVTENIWAPSAKGPWERNYGEKWLFLDHPKHIEQNSDPETSRVSPYVEYSLLHEIHQQWKFCVAAPYQS